MLTPNFNGHSSNVKIFGDISVLFTLTPDSDLCWWYHSPPTDCLSEFFCVRFSKQKKKEILQSESDFPTFSYSYPTRQHSINKHSNDSVHMAGTASKHKEAV